MRFILMSSLMFCLLFSCEKAEPLIVEEDVLENSAGMTVLEEEVLDLINDLRAHGAICGSETLNPVAPLYWNDILDKASEIHVEDMLRNNFVSHLGSDGSTPSERLKMVDYKYFHSGENVAKGPQTIEVAIQEFMNSPSHCEVIMNPDYTHIGIARNQNYWVLNFASPRGY